ncbi:hypothetical protein Q757_01710 [Oenococcus alcoholitolerans]|uniref:GHMP kinase N-terminal domain-containing protein n=1 Tax=Oenococcus alcoholitolerans TaxID=931074 RepID=A0ABR4XS47_9LACO|nr:hypothetical protein Q757_01710 [Oenococcus alcoholitolerans]
MTKEIIVPATSANMGPGFDSIGCAVNLYLKVQIGPASEEWHVDHPFGNKVADDASNLIVQSALNADPDIKSHIIEVKSEIPLTRGLGSSSSAIIAGLLLGKELSQKKSVQKNYWILLLKWRVIQIMPSRLCLEESLLAAKIHWKMINS